MKVHQFREAYNHLRELHGGPVPHTSEFSYCSDTPEWNMAGEVCKARAVLCGSKLALPDGSTMVTAPNSMNAREFSMYRFMRDGGWDHFQVTKHRTISDGLREFLLQDGRFRTVKSGGLVVPETAALDRVQKHWSDGLAALLRDDPTGTQKTMIAGGGTSYSIIVEEGREAMERASESACTTRALMDEARERMDRDSDLPAVVEGARPKAAVVVPAQVDGWGAWA